MLIVFSTAEKYESDSLAEKGAELYFDIFGGKRRLSFSHNTDGSPCFKERGGKISDIKISISHSKNLIFAVISTSNAGIDVQFHDENIDKSAVSKRIFNREITDSKEFFDAWAQGEAHIKFAGLNPLNGFSSWEKSEKTTVLLPLFNDYSTAYECFDKEVFIHEL